MRTRHNQESTIVDEPFGMAKGYYASMTPAPIYVDDIKVFYNRTVQYGLPGGMRPDVFAPVVCAVTRVSTLLREFHL